MNYFYELLILFFGSGGVVSYFLFRKLHKETTREKKITNEILILDKVNQDNQQLRLEITAQDLEIQHLKKENEELRQNQRHLYSLLLDLAKLLPPDAAARFDLERFGNFAKPTT